MKKRTKVLMNVSVLFVSAMSLLFAAGNTESMDMHGAQSETQKKVNSLFLKTPSPCKHLFIMVMYLSWITINGLSPRKQAN